MKRLMLLGVALVVAAMAYATTTVTSQYGQQGGSCGSGTTSCQIVSANNDGRITSIGSTKLTGTTSGAGFTVTYGVVAATMTATATGGAVVASTSTTSTAHLCLAGAFQSLPTTGYNKGCFAYQLSDDKMYASSQTVVGSQSWKALW